jgi:hypothetical protein
MQQPAGQFGQRMIAVQQPAGQNGQQYGQQYGQPYGQQATMTMPPPQHGTATMNYMMAPQQQMPQQQMPQQQLPQQQQQQGMQPPMQYGGPVHQQYGQF